MEKKKESIVISLGGSLIVPDEIDTDFLRVFRDLISEFKDKKIIIICGGGKIARNYQNAARKILKLNNKDADWLGIYAIKINALLVKIIFGNLAHETMVDYPYRRINFKEKVLIASVAKPGWSSDYDAVLLAKNFGIKKLVNLSNINFVYDKDPKKFKNAKPIKLISWKEFRNLLPKKWSPGLNAPFDPVAAREAEKIKLEVTVMNGKNMNNFKNYLEGKKFIGTLIK